jgi:16S rRNA (guanine527-N7)-methyltransferase
MRSESRSGTYGPTSFQASFAATPAQIAKLETYAALLRKWQKAVNLVARDSLDAIWHRHFADSAQLLQLISPGSSCLDFGTGAGFPGMVIAILSVETGARVHLVESNARKCAFLREVARQTGTSVEIHNARVEEIATKGTVNGVDVVMARGVAPLAKLLEWSQPFFRGDTIGLFLKGRRVDGEIDEARKAWTFALRAHPSVTEPDGKVLEIRALERLEGRT